MTGISNFGAFCCASLTNPVLPGPAYVASGFNGLLPAGEQRNWIEVFVNPYSFASNGGIPTNRANGFTFALRFTLRPTGPPAVRSAISAGAFGAQTSVAPGTWIEIYGSNFAVGTQGWAAEDFDGGFGPTRLGGVEVSIGGRKAFVNYVSPEQINAQVPANVGTGQQPVTVSTPLGNSAAFSINVDSLRPGLLAPPSFAVNGAQHVVALFPDNTTYVLPPGAVAGLNSRRARPGDTITLYGIGFGGVTPAVAPGQIATQLNTLVSPYAIRFGGTQASVTYAGLAPNFVGLYQFNVTVPQVAAGDAVPLTFTLNGADVPQRLVIAVGN